MRITIMVESDGQVMFYSPTGDRMISHAFDVTYGIRTVPSDGPSVESEHDGTVTVTATVRGLTPPEGLWLTYGRAMDRLRAMLWHLRREAVSTFTQEAPPTAYSELVERVERAIGDPSTLVSRERPQRRDAHGT